MAELKNGRHELFCQKYITRLKGRIYNGTQSAIAAGYSERTAGVTACKLLKNPKIQARIEELKKQTMQRIKKDQYHALDLIVKAATSDLRNYLHYYQDHEGNIKIDLKDSNQVDTSMIQEVKIGKDGQFSFKLVDKAKAREELARYTGLYEQEGETEKHALEGLVNAMVTVAEKAAK